MTRITEEQEMDYTPIHFKRKHPIPGSPTDALCGIIGDVKTTTKVSEVECNSCLVQIRHKRRDRHEQVR